MRKIIILLPIAALLLQSCGTLTPEEIKHEQWKREQDQIELEKDRAFRMEIFKIEAEAEKNKPVEVRVQEVKNQETTVGEGIETAVGIGAATALGFGLLHIMTK